METIKKVITDFMLFHYKEDNIEIFKTLFEGKEINTVEDVIHKMIDIYECEGKPAYLKSGNCNLADVSNWPENIRLNMIEKSEFYSEPKIYQYGYYDGYQKLNQKRKNAIQLIQAYRSDICKGDKPKDSLLQDAIIEMLD